MSKFKRAAIVTSLLMVFFIQSLSSITTQSATFDEVQYFGLGKYLLINHKWDVMGAILHPPLSFYLNSIPLLFVNEDKKLWEYDVAERDLTFLGAVDFYRGQELLSADFNRNDRMLIASRLMFALLSILLGYYVYRFSTSLYGLRAGILSLFMFTFCPNMLAFSGLIVPDMPLTVFSFIAVHYLREYFNIPTTRKMMIAGLFLGLALLTKFTALLLLPVYFIVALVCLQREKRNLFPPLLAIICIALVVLLLGYGFQLKPYFQGIQYQWHKAQIGQASFLIGEYSDHGWWYFYPLAFLLKTPIPVITMFVAALVICFRDKLRLATDSLMLLLPVVTIMIFFVFSADSIALRYLLPIYPFIFVLTGRVAALTSRKAGIAVSVLAVWHLAGSLWIFPHYLAYFNEAAGGPDNGYRYLVDANLDWGQDLKGLKKYLDMNGIKKVSLSYFGADAPHRYGIEYDWLPSHHLFNPEPDKPVTIRDNQLIAISATNLQGVYLDRKDEFAWLKKQQPAAKIGYSIFLYDPGKILQVK